MRKQNQLDSIVGCTKVYGVDEKLMYWMNVLYKGAKACFKGILI